MDKCKTCIKFKTCPLLRKFHRSLCSCTSGGPAVLTMVYSRLNGWIGSTAFAPTATANFDLRQFIDS